MAIYAIQIGKNIEVFHTKKEVYRMMDMLLKESNKITITAGIDVRR